MAHFLTPQTVGNNKFSKIFQLVIFIRATNPSGYLY